MWLNVRNIMTIHVNESILGTYFLAVKPLNHAGKLPLCSMSVSCVSVKHRRTRALSPPSESFVCITAPRLHSILTRSTVHREQQSNALISLHCCSKQDLYL